jgi:hypothetical protein
MKMFRKVAVALALTLPFLGVAATIASLANLKNEFVGVPPLQQRTSTSTIEELEPPFTRNPIAIDDEMRDERC